MDQDGFYLLIGPDHARKRERVEALAQALGVDWLDRHHLEAVGTSPRELAMLLRELPAASPRRLIVIEGAERLLPPCARALHDLLPRLADTAALILLVEEELPASHPLAPAISAARVERFPGRSGGEAGGHPSGGRGGFALIEAVIRRDAGGALKVLHEQVAEGKELLELLGLLMWQLQRWLVVAEGLQAKLPREQLLKLGGGLQPWQLDRLLAEVPSRPPSWVRDRLRRCWEMDLAAKTGRLPMLLPAVEQVIVELCLPAGQASRPVRTPTGPPVSA